MPLLSKSVADAYKARQEAIAGGGDYLNTKSITSDNKVRITFLGDESATGYIAWCPSLKDPQKKVRLVFAEEPTRSDIEERAAEEAADPKDAKPRQFFSFFVWNYNDEKVQVFEIAQSTLLTPILEFLSDEEVSAEPHLYDLEISASGSGLDKRYTCIPKPGKRRTSAVDKQVVEAFTEVLDKGADISVVSSGGDPWKGKPF